MIEDYIINEYLKKLKYRTKKTYIKKLRELLSFNAFILDAKFIIRDDSDDEDYIGTYVFLNKTLKIFYLDKSYLNIIKYTNDGQSENTKTQIGIKKFFTEELEVNEVFYLYLLNIKELHTISNKRYIFNIFKTSNKLILERIKTIKFPQFLLGSGVSIGCGSLSWGEMIDKFETMIKSIDSNLDPKKINEKLFNTLYGIPQILKDISINDYYDCIEKCLYPKSSQISKKGNKTLTAISNVLAYQSKIISDNKIIKVVTFNFDNFLENELFSKSISYKSTYYRDRSVTGNLEIAHIHGYFPKNSSHDYEESFLNNYKSSIVLTDLEYNKMYNSKYTPKVLKDFLNKPTFIVGNSISDYEERKILSNVKNNCGPYHFNFRVWTDDIYNDLYIYLYLLSIGVIVVYFKNYSDIADFIESNFAGNK